MKKYTVCYYENGKFKTINMYGKDRRDIKKQFSEKFGFIPLTTDIIQFK